MKHENVFIMRFSLERTDEYFMIRKAINSDGELPNNYKPKPFDIPKANFKEVLVTNVAYMKYMYYINILMSEDNYLKEKSIFKNSSINGWEFLEDE